MHNTSPLLIFCLFLFCSIRRICGSFFFFFNDTATTEIYTLSLHDALPIYSHFGRRQCPSSPPSHNAAICFLFNAVLSRFFLDRKSTRLNSSHGYISYAVFCLKKTTRNNDFRALTQSTLSHVTSSPYTLEST